MWVRGLKRLAPLVFPTFGKSHPMWVRGLKLIDIVIYCQLLSVAPYVGAWIETLTTLKQERSGRVAPYVGAWIETQATFVVNTYHMKSHPMWVRGLKLEKKVRYTKVYGRTLCGCVD